MSLGALALLGKLAAFPRQPGMSLGRLEALGVFLGPFGPLGWLLWLLRLPSPGGLLVMFALLVLHERPVYQLIPVQAA
jgi:hypothetical protein